MKYEAENQAKACFDDLYTAPTPHAYIATMARTGYEIGEQVRPYVIAAADLLKDQGKHLAELFIGARPDHFSGLFEKMNEVSQAVNPNQPVPCHPQV